MFSLDENFLQEVGLAELPEAQRQPFLQHVYDQLELRVGTRLSEGMSDAQLEEFESIIDRRDDVIQPWLAANVPAYQSDEVFARLQQSMGVSADSPELRAEFAATKWLEVNRPDYRDVVAATLQELKQEIAANKDAILGQAPQAPAA